MTYPWPLTFFLCLLPIASALFYFFFADKSPPKKLPPGPSSLPLLGNLHQLRNPLHLSLLNLAKRHGDLMFIRAGFVPTLVISSADAARDVIKNHDLAFSGRPCLHVASKISYDNTDIVFSPYGDHWREMKKIAILELLSVKKVQSFGAVRDDEVALLVDSIHGSLETPVDLSELLHRLSNNVVCRVAFGRKFQAKSSELSPQEMLKETQALIGSICLSDFFPWLQWLNKLNGVDARLKKNFNDLDRLFDQLIHEHLRTKKHSQEDEDLIDVLLRLRSEPNRCIAITDKLIKALISDMFIAGTDTSSATLTWAMTELLRNPRVMKRAQEEVRSAVKGRRSVAQIDLPRLTYLNAVVKETLRFHPPGPLLIPRETIDAVTIRGYDIPAGTRVFINATAISMDPRSWSEPEKFLPERFLENPIDFIGNHFEFIPFGAGRRICPGTNFAVCLIELTLANMLHRFDWKLPSGVTRDNMNVEEAIGLTVLKKTPLVLIPVLAGGAE